MRCQIPFFGKNKNIINLSSAEFAQKVGKVKCYITANTINFPPQTKPDHMYLNVLGNVYLRPMSKGVTLPDHIIHVYCIY